MISIMAKSRASNQARRKKVIESGKRKRNRNDKIIYGEFDPGSGRTLAACLIHASRARQIKEFTFLFVERRTGE
jgi:hypothetical protein